MKGSRAAAAVAGGMTLLALRCAAAAHGAQSVDAAFVQRAARMGWAQVQFAQLASRDSRTPDVVSVAARVRADEGAANGQLASIARAQRFAFAPDLAAGDRRKLARLAAQRGHGFDRSYVTTQLDAERASLALYEREAARGRNRYLVAFANEMIPIFEKQIFIDKRVRSDTGRRPPAG